MSLTAFVQARDLEFRFGQRRILQGLSLNLQRGEALALFGPNGAGKTTLLRLLATLLQPSKGEAFLDGISLARRSERPKARRRIGFLSHQSMLYERLTARDNLRFYARMYAVEDPERRCAELFEQVELEGREDDPVEEYSRGMQQRLALARALVHDPDLVLLDEPFSGLDPRATLRLGTLLAELARRGKAVLFTSHDLAAGLSIAHRVAILWRGTLAYEARQEGLTLDVLARAYASLAERVA
ncbi:MAG: heme ABC exporter ATP-binding protein CcmA [Acidobacteria bacterium]|nr:heme ABC exporter ATP-binding protein CcmA [Acidobacteriota bacterium]